MLDDLEAVQLFSLGFIAAFLLLYPLYLIEAIRCERWRKRYEDSRPEPTPRAPARPNSKGAD